MNKVDRENARPHKVARQVFELFMELGATDDQLDFPVIYASGKRRLGHARNLDEPQRQHGAAVRGHHRTHPGRRRRRATCSYFQMLVSNLDYSDYLGRIAYRPHHFRPRESRRQCRPASRKDGDVSARTSPRFSAYVRLEATVEVENASAGDIIGLCGFEEASSARPSPTPSERLPIHFVRRSIRRRSR